MSRAQLVTLILQSWLFGALAWLAPFVNMYPQQARAEERTDPTERPRRIPMHKFVWSGSISRLVFDRALGEELGITAEDRQELNKAIGRAEPSLLSQQRMRALKNANTRLSSAKHSGDRQQIAAAQANLDAVNQDIANGAAACDRAVRRLLSPAQYKRLVEILLQQEGARALKRPEIAAKLELLKPQMALIQQILADREREIEAWHQRIARKAQESGSAREVERLVRKAREQGPLSREEHKVLDEFWERAMRNTAELDRFEDRVDAQLWRVLTPAQKRRFNKLRGEPFDMHQLTREGHLEAERLAKAAEKAESAQEDSEKSEDPSRPDEDQ